MTRIAILGAGVSGLTVANNLKNHAEITIFEKARSVGGRMSMHHHIRLRGAGRYAHRRNIVVAQAVQVARTIRDVSPAIGLI
jgi:predicted NAD/FAD-binding protein